MSNSAESPAALPDGLVVADTITKLGPDAVGAVVVSGSHGGVYPAYLAAKGGVRAVILNDAGIGMDDAGIGSLGYCQALGLGAATVSHESARIGDTADMLVRGRISHINRVAEGCGVQIGMSCLSAAKLMRGAPHCTVEAPVHEEARTVLPGRPGERSVILIDSASLVESSDENQIVVTGSHGGLIGSDPAKALQVNAYAAVYNDAGFGVEGAGATRLPALEQRGILAFVVDCNSARIGDGRSCYEDGVISAVNDLAAAAGAKIGDSAKTTIERWR